MSDFDYLSCIKRKAKFSSKQSGLKLSKELDSLAREGRFDGYHELKAVFKNNPNDPRFRELVFGKSNLGELLNYDGVYQLVDKLLAEKLPCHTWSKCLNVSNGKGSYDQSNGICTFDAQVTEEWDRTVYYDLSLIHI